MSATASDNQAGGGHRRDYRPTGTFQGTSLFATLRRTVTDTPAMLKKIERPDDQIAQMKP
jgi:hypothetical protein